MGTMNIGLRCLLAHRMRNRDSGLRCLLARMMGDPYVGLRCLPAHALSPHKRASTL